MFQPVGLKTIGSYNQGYNQWFLQAGVLHTGVLATGCLTTRDFYMRGVATRSSYFQGFLRPGVVTSRSSPSRGIMSKGLTCRGY